MDVVKMLSRQNDQKHKSKHGYFPYRGGCDQKIYFDQIDEKNR